MPIQNEENQMVLDSPGPIAGDIISAGNQLLQIRTRNQLLVAIQRPRDMDKFEKHLVTMAASAGEDFFYSIPYKEHTANCKDRRNCNCPKTYVEGPGVGLARAAAALWGNCSIDTRIEQEVPDAWLVRSDFVDFETNYTRSETKRVSKLKPLKGGKMVVASGKDLDVTYQIGASKVERDCIVRALPKHIIDRAFELAKAADMAQKMPVDQQLARLQHKFREINVSVAMIEANIGCAFTEAAIRAADQDPRDVCASLRGLLTAIKGGEIAVEDAFAAPSKPTTSTATPGPVTATGLVGQNGKTIVSSGGGESSKAQGSEPEPGKDQGHEGDDAHSEKPIDPPPALSGAAENGKAEPEPEELFVCLTCKSKKRQCEYTAAQVADAAGKCPRCLTAKDLVPKSEAEDAPAPSPAPAKETGPKATVRCLGCKKEYAVKPAKCECGSSLGWKKI